MIKTIRGAIQSIRQNSLRSFLAGFGIAWGIFLLVILLGVGNGFRNGVMSLFSTFAQKSLFVYAGKTSEATSELNENAVIRFEKGITEDIRRRYGCILACSEEMSIPSIPVSANGESLVSAIQGVGEDYFKIRILEAKEGRLLNRLDNLRARNVVIIGEGIKQSLFGKTDALNNSIHIGNSIFKVIGVLSSEDIFSVAERNSIYIPTSSFSSNFDSTGQISSFSLSLSEDIVSSEVEKDIHDYLAWRYGFDPHDEMAVQIANIETQTKSFRSLFNGLTVLIWIVGICLLLSGIVGVCNVMLIIVKERTSEIGIRKAVGATSRSIISMIMTESITITFIAGMVGATLGGAVVLIADKLLMPMLDSEIMSSLDIDFPAVTAAFAILCLSGLLAGLFPALKASQITPVEAIRYENRE